MSKGHPSFGGESLALYGSKFTSLSQWGKGKGSTIRVAAEVLCISKDSIPKAVYPCHDNVSRSDRTDFFKVPPLAWGAFLLWN